MPDNLNLAEWLKWGLTECAIQLGFPLEEFIGGHASTLLGQSGAEVQTGAMRGATKGGAEFINLFQEAMNNYVVPSTMYLEFHDRSLDEELQEWELKKCQAEVITELYQAVRRVRTENFSDDGELQSVVNDERIDDVGLLTDQEARRWMVEIGLAPTWLSDEEEQVTVDNDERSELREWREMAKDNDRIAAHAQWKPDEPIIRQESNGVAYLLFDSGHEMLKRSVWNGIEIDPVKRTTYRADPNVIGTLGNELFTDDYLQEVEDDELDGIIEIALGDAQEGAPEDR